MTLFKLGGDEEDRRRNGASRDGDVERRAWDVVVAPLDHQDVAAPLLEQVADGVLQAAQVFDQNLLTGDLGAVHAHQQHVLTWEQVEKTREKNVPTPALRNEISQKVLLMANTVFYGV